MSCIDPHCSPLPDLLNNFQPILLLFSCICLFLVFVGAGKDLNPDDVRKRSHILQNIRVALSWPTLSAFMCSVPAQTWARPVIPAKVLMSREGGGVEKKRQTTAEIWRGRAHTCTNAQMRVAVVHLSSASVLLCITHGEEKNLAAAQEAGVELRKSRSGVTSPCLPHQWVIVAPPHTPFPWMHFAAKGWPESLQTDRAARLIVKWSGMTGRVY